MYNELIGTLILSGTLSVSFSLPITSTGACTDVLVTLRYTIFLNVYVTTVDG